MQILKSPLDFHPPGSKQSPLAFWQLWGSPHIHKAHKRKGEITGDKASYDEFFLPSHTIRGINQPLRSSAAIHYDETQTTPVSIFSFDVN